MRSQVITTPAQEEPPALLGVMVGSVATARRQKARFEALEIQSLSFLMDEALASAHADGSCSSKREDLAIREVAAMVACEAHANDRTVQRQMGEAHVIVNDYPGVLAALSEGVITKAHVSVIVNAGTGITDPGVRDVYASRAVAIAMVESPSRTRAMIEPLAELAQPTTAQERHDRACERRRVELFDEADGMSTLTAYIPSTLAHGAFDRLTQMAKNLNDLDPESDTLFDDPAAVANRSAFGYAADHPDAAFERATTGAPAHADAIASNAAGATGDAGISGVLRSRTIDQRRADAFADLLLAGMPQVDDDPNVLPTTWANVQGRVSVTMPVDTVLGGDSPGFLPTGAMVAPDDARRLAGYATGWDRIFIEPATGDIECVDRYKPSAAQRRFLTARDQHCRFPGCRQQAIRCDIDHNLDAALGGLTSLNNLAHLCRRHHTLKHHTRWKVRHLPGGILEWTSPTGHIYYDTPPGVRFTETQPDPVMDPAPDSGSADPPF